MLSNGSRKEIRRHSKLKTNRAKALVRRIVSVQYTLPHLLILEFSKYLWSQRSSVEVSPISKADVFSPRKLDSVML